MRFVDIENSVDVLLAHGWVECKRPVIPLCEREVCEAGVTKFIREARANRFSEFHELPHHLQSHNGAGQAPGRREARGGESVKTYGVVALGGCRGRLTGERNQFARCRIDLLTSEIGAVDVCVSADDPGRVLRHVCDRFGNNPLAPCQKFNPLD